MRKMVTILDFTGSKIISVREVYSDYKQTMIIVSERRAKIAL